MALALITILLVILQLPVFLLKYRDIPKILLFTIIVGCAFLSIACLSEGRNIVGFIWLFNTIIWYYNYKNHQILTKMNSPFGDYEMSLEKKNITIKVRGIDVTVPYRYWYDSRYKEEFTTNSLDEETLARVWKEYHKITRVKNRVKLRLFG